MVNTVKELKSDTWAIIAAGAALAAIIVTIMLAQNAATNRRIVELSERLDAFQEATRVEHAALRAEHDALRAEHADMRAEHADMRAEHDDMRAEHVEILQSLSEVAQRVSYIEGRLHIGITAESSPAIPP